jgi:addiction module HigA family antidote
MPKKPPQSPGTVLLLLLRAYQMNPTSLARQIRLSQASVRLMTLDKIKISAQAALRLGKFFNIKPDYWMDLQKSYDLSVAAKDSKLAAELKKIPIAEKPRLHKGAEPAKKSAGTKTAGKRGRAKKTKVGEKPAKGRRGRLSKNT